MGNYYEINLIIVGSRDHTDAGSKSGYKINNSRNNISFIHDILPKAHLHPCQLLFFIDVQKLPEKKLTKLDSNLFANFRNKF
ncbi:hypothetical protein BpHYR1_045239 [Brachionus plicatilis]|uniref:Uncharacterized protein n=1 Tax=Brachionus plicatilis TaxID=10195 RepID=A0A3M7SGK6_BRAPC|nr:hypothetical protein BpHYR1_045239 [Brachionus plicatilis]